MKDLITELDKNFEYVNHELAGGYLLLRVRSNRETVVCPYCHTPSKRVHSIRDRVLQDLPTMEHKTQIILEQRKMFCDSPDCGHKTFSERFDCIRPYARKSKRLCDKIIDISLGLSTVEAARTLNNGICDIGRETISNLQKKKISHQKEAAPTIVCIDDFALKRRYRYGTCMSDAQTHRIIDLIASRDEEDVQKWLAAYPTIRIVVRDGSKTYRKAVENALPGSIQVGDRFHLMKNVLEAANAAIMKLPVRIRLESAPAPGTEPVQMAHERELTPSECRRGERAAAARALYNQGMPLAQIAREIGACWRTVRRYCQEGYEPVCALAGMQRNGPYTKWLTRLKELLCADGRLKGTDAFRILSAEGYTGSYETIKSYMRKLRGRNTWPCYSGPSVKRSDLSRMLYKGSETQSGIPAEHYARIAELHPEIQPIFDTVAEFRMILKSRRPDLLDQWIAETKEHVCVQLQRAARGIEQDIDAAYNAIRFPYSNGIAEGNNTKLKQNMRVGYGRCSFETLKTRVLLRDARRLCTEKTEYII